MLQQVFCCEAPEKFPLFSEQRTTEFSFRGWTTPLSTRLLLCHFFIVFFLTRVNPEKLPPLLSRRCTWRRVARAEAGFTSGTWTPLETKTSGDSRVTCKSDQEAEDGRRKRPSLVNNAVAVREAASGSPAPVRSAHIHGSPPAHLHRPDRRRGCPGLRALHRLELLLQEANMVTAGGILHHQRGEKEGVEMPPTAQPSNLLPDGETWWATKQPHNSDQFCCADEDLMRLGGCKGGERRREPKENGSVDRFLIWSSYVRIMVDDL